jgi:cellulase/cellobiase CelA1
MANTHRVNHRELHISTEDNLWGTGYCLDFGLLNTSEALTNGWPIQHQVKGVIDNIWNADAHGD